MPYIEQERRDALANGGFPENSGELNYKLTLMCLEYMNVHGKRYAIINDIIGALEGAKAEFYRRVVAPYEDIKIKENGDVY